VPGNILRNLEFVLPDQFVNHSILLFILILNLAVVILLLIDLLDPFPHLVVIERFDISFGRIFQLLSKTLELLVDTGDLIG
jgi:hypothetical protein